MKARMKTSLSSVCCFLSTPDTGSRLLVPQFCPAQERGHSLDQSRLVRQSIRNDFESLSAIFPQIIFKLGTISIDSLYTNMLTCLADSEKRAIIQFPKWNSPSPP